MTVRSSQARARVSRVEPRPPHRKRSERGWASGSEGVWEAEDLKALNGRHAESRLNTELKARTASYEPAFRMQAEAPDAVDISKETEATRALYGMDQKETAKFGGICLLARRLVERGVRFMQLYSGGGG